MKKRWLTLMTTTVASMPCLCFSNCCSNGAAIVCEDKEQATTTTAFYSFQFAKDKPDKTVFDSIFLIQSDDTPLNEMLRIDNNPVIQQDGSFIINVSFVHPERPQEQKHIKFKIYFEWISHGKTVKQTVSSLDFFYDIKIIPPTNTKQIIDFWQQDNLYVYQTQFGPFKLCDESIPADSLIPFISQDSGEEIGEIFATITINRPYFYIGLYAENTEKATEGTYSFTISISSNSEQIYEDSDYEGEISYE